MQSRCSYQTQCQLFLSCRKWKHYRIVFELLESICCYLAKQWAAVSIRVEDIRAPPHSYLFPFESEAFSLAYQSKLLFSSSLLVKVLPQWTLLNDKHRHTKNWQHKLNVNFFMLLHVYVHRMFNFNWNNNGWITYGIGIKHQSD